MHRNEYLCSNTGNDETTTDDELRPGNLPENQLLPRILKQIIVFNELVRFLRHLEELLLRRLLLNHFVAPFSGSHQRTYSRAYHFSS